MSAGFGVGFSRQFCPDAPLQERISVLSELLRTSSLTRLRDFVHPEDRPDWGQIMNKEQYGVVELTSDGQDVGWSWLDEEETQRLHKTVDQQWSDSGSFEDCFLISDEETGLVLPGEGDKVLWSHPSLQAEDDSVVYARFGQVIGQLKDRMADRELGKRDVLERALRLLNICQREQLPFYLAWS
jgi:hypothetical protein